MSLFQKPLRGIVPPMVTPLLNRDELDLAGLDRLVEHQVKAGVAGLFVLGTTGEGPSLSYRLRYELVERTCEIVAGRVPVLVGITDTSVEEALELSQFSKGAGANAVVAAPPYYFGLGQAEVREFLRDVADESVLPMFVYNMPSCVKLSLTVETIEQLSDHKNICGVKDSGGDIEWYRQLLKLRSVRPDWTFLIGPEHLMAESVLMGGDGGVNGGGNLYPRLFVSLFQAADRKDQKEIDRLQEELLRLGELYNICGAGPAGYLRGLKSGLEAAGICSGRVAPPFIEIDETERTRVAALIKTLGLAQAGKAANVK
ncbi:dihydrodipicolinate synthase family protein [Schlesneria paludicola]|uniref:dihydrodipicolinate synthase family protein n=1 Tax=Schlesneria paludicola TaxID=360056 RepID=UPI00029B4443|nr:dihydrodipicolinate synthase family protein [Schlesneria paludicola]